MKPTWKKTYGKSSKPEKIEMLAITPPSKSVLELLEMFNGPKLLPYQEAIYSCVMLPPEQLKLSGLDIGPAGAFAIERFNHLTRHGYKLDLVRGVYVK